MPLQVSLAGSQLVAGPVGAQGFPSATVDVTFQLSPDPKPYNVTTGAATYQVSVASPSWQALGGVGANGPVTRAHTVFIRALTPLAVRVTYADASTRVMLVSGLLVFEPQVGNEATLLEVQGSGQIEYAAYGNT